MSDLKTTDGVKERGLRGLDGKGLMEAIQKNIAILRACTAHDFELKESQSITNRVWCKHCGGEMSVSDARLYTRGYQSGYTKGYEDGLLFEAKS